MLSIGPEIYINLMTFDSIRFNIQLNFHMRNKYRLIATRVVVNAAISALPAATICINVSFLSIIRLLRKQSFTFDVFI